MLTMPAGAKRISSRTTYFNKQVFPIVWFGSLMVFTAIALTARGSVPLLVVLIPVLMLVLGYFLFKKLIFDLMDEAWDDGNELILVNDGHVERIALSNIMNISYSGLTNPKRVTLSLRSPCRWGATITFTPPVKYSLSSLISHPLVEDLIRRVDEARR